MKIQIVTKEILGWPLLNILCIIKERGIGNL